MHPTESRNKSILPSSQGERTTTIDMPFFVQEPKSSVSPKNISQLGCSDNIVVNMSAISPINSDRCKITACIKEHSQREVQHISINRIESRLSKENSETKKREMV